MTRFLCLLVVSPLVGLPLLGALHAQAVRGEKYAFLLACSRYNSTQLRDLPYTIEEMEDFKKALLASGYDPGNIVMLHDRCERDAMPLKANVLRMFHLVLAGMQPADSLVVAINGHGVHYKGERYGHFCPLDGDVCNKDTLVPMDDFYEALKKCKARQKLMIVQACQNDPFVAVDFASQKLALVEHGDDVPEGIAAIFSCMEGQRSYFDPDRKRGLFFDHVIRAWRGEYLAPGDSRLDVETFFYQVRVRTKADALRYRGGVQQVPEVRRDYKGQWVLSQVAPVAAIPPATPVGAAAPVAPPAAIAPVPPSVPTPSIAPFTPVPRPIQPAVDRRLTGLWAGRYSYPDTRPPVAFHLNLVQEDRRLAGTTKEPNTFWQYSVRISRNEPYLYANCKGSFDGSNGRVNFIKTYDGTAGADSSAEYNGFLSADRTKIVGIWIVREPGQPELRGTFTLQKIFLDTPTAPRPQAWPP